MPQTTVLIVEDEVIVAEDIRMSLEQAGYGVTAVVASGADALRSAATVRPDIVLMDIVLQGDRDGVQTAALIRERFGLPVLYLTAYADAATVQRAKGTVPFGYLLKPFNERQLVASIETTVSMHALETELRERKRWLWALLHSIREAVIATDAVGCVTMLNPAAETLTGWEAKEAVGKEITEVVQIVDMETRLPLPNPLMQVLRETQVVRLLPRVHLLARDSTVVPIADAVAPIYDRDGAIIGAVGVFHDTTEHMQAEEALLQTYDQLGYWVAEYSAHLQRVHAARQAEFAERRQVLIVDEHPITRRGLTHMINQQSDLMVCGEAPNVQQALKLVAALHPDLVLVDLALSRDSRLEHLKILRGQASEVPILVVSRHDEQFFAERVLRAGAQGFVMKQVEEGGVLRAIRRVLRGEVSVSEQVEANILRTFTHGDAAPRDALLPNLTDRELEVLHCLGQGYSTRQVAEALHLSVKTVETYRARLMEKLHVANAQTLIRYAIQWVRSIDTS